GADRPAAGQGGADRFRGPGAPLPGAVRPDQSVRAVSVPGGPLGRQEASATHQKVSPPAKRSVGFCPFAIARPYGSTQRLPERIVLASSSRYRQQMLSRLELPFEVCIPDVDEATEGRAMVDPYARAEYLADLKASRTARLHGAATVIGGDQLVLCGNEVF